MPQITEFTLIRRHRVGLLMTYSILNNTQHPLNYQLELTHKFCHSLLAELVRANLKWFLKGNVAYFQRPRTISGHNLLIFSLLSSNIPRFLPGGISDLTRCGSSLRGNFFYSAKNHLRYWRPTYALIILDLDEDR